MNFRRLIAPVMVAGASALMIGSVTAMAASSATEFNPYVSDSRSAPAAAITALGGTSTTVTLDPGTAQVLKQNNVTVAPAAPATASQTGGSTTVTFPVTGGEAFIFPTKDTPYIRGDVFHSGGLTFSSGSKSLTVTNFVINPGTSLLTAQVGNAEVPLFELDGQNVKIGKDAQGNVTLDGTIVKLTPEAANALNTTFGVSIFKEGITVGTAHVVLTPASS